MRWWKGFRDFLCGAQSGADDVFSDFSVLMTYFSGFSVLMTHIDRLFIYVYKACV